MGLRPASRLAPPLSAALLFVLLALAGCASKPASGSDIQFADGKTVDLDAAAQQAQASRDQGVISGVVVDATIRPVAGANVTLAVLGTATRTDANGLFVFSALRPGLYTLRIVATDFLPIQTSAEVKAGETTKVRVQLEPHFVPKPYHGPTLKFRGFYQASSGFADEVLDLAVWNHTYGGQRLPSGCTCRFGFTSDGNMTTVVLELRWDESIDHSAYHPLGGSWTMDVTDEAGKGPLQFCDADGQYKPPCIIHENSVGNFSANARNYKVGVWSDPSWAYINENFELYVTPFYIAAAPHGWSFIKGST